MADEQLNECSDDELAARVRRGDERAFEVLYFRHREFVYRVARRFAGEDETALDAAQQTFAYLFRKLPRLRLTSKLSTYLYPIAKNFAISERRRSRRDVDREFPLGSDAPADGGAGGGDGEVARAVASLPDAQREVLVMRIVDDMSVEEVAAATGVPAGTVKSRLFHALAALRDRPELRRYWEE